MAFLWFVLGLGFLVPVDCWSGDGHRIVAKIASHYLKQSTKFFVWDLLGPGKMDKLLIEESVFADTVAWSQDLHFVHTPYRACEEFVFERDCGFDGSGRCTVSAIANFTMTAIKTDLPKAERADAIRFLIHLMADLHNPMHVGFAEDFGGNSVMINLRESEQSLHEVWDSHLIAFAEKEIEKVENAGIDPWTLSTRLLETMSER